MRLQEIFEQLSVGEFSQLCIGGAAAGVIDEMNYRNVVASVNLALTALHRRFNIRTGLLQLQLHEGINEYRLNPDYAVSNTRSKQLVRYIIDSPAQPFPDDVMKVEVVRDVLGVGLPLNDASVSSIRTLSSTKLEVPADITRQVLELEYRANHPQLTVGQGYFDPARVEVDLPDHFLEPLLYYVASRVHTPMGMANSEGVSAAGYLQRYEMVCQEIENAGLETDQGGTQTRLERNGWA
jgi:hypothetical protein